MISVNRRAAAIVEAMMAEREVLGLDVHTLASGARVVDAGIRVEGSLAAGKLFAEACLGGLAQVSFTSVCLGDATAAGERDLWLPALSVSVSQPSIACMASQYAGWAVKRERFFAMGSGPARALYAAEDLYARLDYRDEAEVAVLLLEGRTLPDEGVAGYVAARCGVDPAHLYLLVAPTASVVGSVQVAARVVETGMHKLVELGFDVGQVVAGWGTCPLAPVAADDLAAIGRTNDAVLYGGQAYYAVRAADEDLEALVGRVPSSASRDYGAPFCELFRRYGDFYKIDPLLFSPAQVAFNNLSSGRTFQAGRVNAGLLRASLMES